jgi:hypothetical protein
LYEVKSRELAGKNNRKKILYVMFAAEVSCIGVTKTRFVDQELKINLNFGINTILKTISENDIPELYGEKLHMVIFHHDKSPRASVRYDLRLFVIIRNKVHPKSRLAQKPPRPGSDGFCYQ